jgi:hypothetical protein
VYVPRKRDRGETSSGGLLALDDIGFVSSYNPHLSQIDRKRKGGKIGSGRRDKYVVRRAQIFGVDSRWRDVWAPKPHTGLSALKIVGNR